jgi:hypothetical protein
MGFEGYIGNLPPARRIDHRKRSLAEADHNSVAPRIDPDVVGVVAEPDAAGQREVRTLVETHRSVAGIGDIERARCGMIGNALRFAEPGDPLPDPAFLQVDDTHAVIAELGHEQKLPVGVEGEVIDTAGHGAKRDLRLEHHGRRVLGPARRREQHADQGHQHRHALHCRILAMPANVRRRGRQWSDA